MRVYVDHIDAQNVARLMRGEAPLPPRSKWYRIVWTIPVLVVLIGLALAAWTFGTWHGQTQRDIAAQYTEQSNE